jgi:hypothetical protein
MESTSNLMNELTHLDDSIEAFQDFCQRHPDEPVFHNLKDYLNYYMNQHPDLIQKEIVWKTNSSRNYVNQYFNGYRQHPNKYKLLPLCIAMGMSLIETNRALMIANQACLNIHDNRDAAIMFCINKQYSVDQTNAFLLENDLECI